jgi:hypothetical protein
VQMTRVEENAKCFCAARTWESLYVGAFSIAHGSHTHPAFRLSDRGRGMSHDWRRWKFANEKGKKDEWASLLCSSVTVSKP